MTVGAPKIVYLNLAEARTAELFKASGTHLKVIEASSDAAVAMIGFETVVSQSSSYRLRDGAEFEGGWGQFYITHEAQPGQWFRILVVDDGKPRAFNVEYAKDVNLGGTLEGIASTVNVNVIAPSTFKTKRVGVINPVFTEIVPANPNRKAVIFLHSNQNSLQIADNANPGTDFITMAGNGSSLTIPTTAAIYGKTASGGDWNTWYMEV